MQSVHVRGFVAVVVIAVLLSRSVSAQRADGLRAGFSAPPVGGEVTVMEQRSFLDSDKYPETYWKVGALITAIPVAIAFNLFYVDDDKAFIFGRILGTAMVAAVGAIPGMAIGGLFPKGKPAEQPAEP